MNRWLRTVSAALAALVVAAPATAAIYVVHLHSGATFETRYKPQDASYDASKVIFLDEVGITIALSKADIDRIESGVEVSGFGYQINDTTVAVGWAPNDAPEAGTPEDQARMAAADAANDGEARTSNEPIYDVESVPATMQLIPTFGGTGDQTYVVPAPAPAPPPAEAPPSE